MSGRCKACNSNMSEEDMCRKFPPDPDGKREYSNLCGHCHEIAVNAMFNTFYESEFEYEQLPLYGPRTMPSLSE